jgi:hypothetical protein
VSPAVSFSCADADKDALTAVILAAGLPPALSTGRGRNDVACLSPATDRGAATADKDAAVATSRMRYLGRRLVRHQYTNANGIDARFPYRPCYVDVIPTTKLPFR